MKIDELMAQLRKVRKETGDVEVVIDTKYGTKSIETVKVEKDELTTEIALKIEGVK